MQKLSSFIELTFQIVFHRSTGSDVRFWMLQSIKDVRDFDVRDFVSDVDTLAIKVWRGGR